MIKELSMNKLVITESSLYPTLYKLLDNKMISDYEERVGKRRIRVYYHIEEDGKKRLADLLDDYKTIMEGMELILNS